MLLQTGLPHWSWWSRMQTRTCHFHSSVVRITSLFLRKNQLRATRILRPALTLPLPALASLATAWAHPTNSKLLVGVVSKHTTLTPTALYLCLCCSRYPGYPFPLPPLCQFPTSLLRLRLGITSLGDPSWPHLPLLSQTLGKFPKYSLNRI